jgi:hypothetical protein
MSKEWYAEVTPVTVYKRSTGKFVARLTLGAVADLYGNSDEQRAEIVRELREQGSTTVRDRRSLFDAVVDDHNKLRAQIDLDVLEKLSQAMCSVVWRAELEQIRGVISEGTANDLRNVASMFSSRFDLVLPRLRALAASEQPASAQDSPAETQVANS